MGSKSRDDIRKLLKSFGIASDEAILIHLAKTPGTLPLHLRLTLEDLTDYGAEPPEQPLRVEIEGRIER